ncbi:phage tail tape measure protein [Clostridium sp. JNZ J1-5]
MAINVGTAVAYLTLDRSNFRNSLRSAGEELRNFTRSGSLTSLGNSMTILGSTMTKAVTLPLAGIGAVASKASMDFEEQMSKVKAISGATGEDFNKLREQAIKLGADTSFSASEAANGMENLASAGFKTNEIMSAMPGMLSLAAAGGVDIATASDIAGSSLRGFGLEASKATHVADVLARTASDTNAGITDTGEAMKYIAPVAHALGISLEDTAAGIGLLSNAGIKGSQAGTTLRSALTNLASPSKRASKVMKELGMNFFDVHGKMLPLGEVLGILQDKTKKLTQQQKANVMETLFGKEALSGMLALVDQGKPKFDELSRGLKNSTGASKEMADTMQDNLKGSIEAMKGSLETAAIRIGDVLAPSIRKAANFIAELTNKFSALPKPIQATIVKIGAIAAVTGPALIVFSLLIKSVNTVISSFSGLFRMVRMFATLPGLITPHTLIIVGAILAIGLIVYQVIKHWDALKKAAGKLFSSISSVFKKLSGVIRTSINGWKSMFNGLKSFFSNLGGHILDGLIGGLKRGTGKVKDAMTGIGSAIKSTFKKVLGINSPSRVFAEYGGFIGEGLIQGIDKQNGTINGKFSGLANKIKSLGNVRPDFDGLNNLALSGAYSSNYGLNNVTNSNSKQLNFNPTIYMNIKLDDTGAKGTKQLTSELKGMTKTAMKNSMIEMFMQDAVKSF